MPPKKRNRNKHDTAPRGRRVPLDELMAMPEAARRSDVLLPAKSMEASWVQWSRVMKGVDARTMLLLRAAFDAGYEAGYEAGR